MPLLIPADRLRCPSGAVRCLAVALVLAIAAPAAWAQNYKSDEVARALSSKGGLAKRYAKNGDGDGELFKQYIEQYFFQSMTVPTPEGLADLARSQSDLFKYYLTPTANPQARSFVHEKATEYAVRVTNDRKYHPAVRYNAMLVLGRLRDNYAAKTPSAAANKELCKWAERGATNDKVYGYELAGALIGLERHTRTGQLGTAEARQSMGALYKVLKTDKLPMPLDKEVSDWLYLTAAKAIGNFQTPGPRNGLFAALVAKKAADDKIASETRATIAAELDRMNLAPGKVKAEPIVKIISELALEIAEEESEIATSFEDMQLRGGGRMVAAARGKASRRISEGDQRQPVLVREGLLDVLTDLRKSVGAVKGAAAAADQQKMETIEQAISNAISVTGDKDRGDLNVTDAVKSMARQIKDLVAPEAEEPADEDFAEVR